MVSLFVFFNQNFVNICSFRILSVENELDLNRDVLKSDTASIEIPEIELEIGMGSLGSLFTTVEGMIVKITDSLKDCFAFQGDSTTPEQKKGFQKVIENLENLIEKKEKFTLIIDDAADHSFIGKRIVNGQFLCAVNTKCLPPYG